MEPVHPNKTSVSIMMLTLAVFAVAIPFSSKITYEGSKKTPLVLRTSDELRLLSSDRDGNDVEDWRDLVLGSLSTTTEAAFARAEPNKEAEARLADKNNVTASFSKNIFTVAAYASNNPNLSEDEKTNLVADAVRTEAPKTQPKVYTTSDLRIAASNSSDAKILYGNTMALLLEKANKGGLGSNDLLLLQTYTEKGDPELLAPLASKKVKVDQILEELLTVSVPSSALVFHLRLINSVSAFSATLDGFARADSDPLRSLAFLNTYQETITKLYGSMNDLQDYFTLENVPFQSSDPGYIFISKK